MQQYPSEVSVPTLLIVLASALLAQAATVGALADPVVQVDVIDAASWRLTITVPGTQNPATAQAGLVSTAAQLCIGRFPRFGRYTFGAKGLAPGRVGEPADAVTLIQTLTCADTAETTESTGSGIVVPIVLDEARATQLQPTIMDLSNRYLEAVEQGRDEEAYGMTLPETTGGASLADWSARLETKRGSLGPATSHTIAKLTWYPDPPNSPRPGLYVAVDYVASWALQDECGYVVWFSPKVEGPFLLVRQEQTFLPHDIDADTRAALRLQHCILL